MLARCYVTSHWQRRVVANLYRETTESPRPSCEKPMRSQKRKIFKVSKNPFDHMKDELVVSV